MKAVEPISSPIVRKRWMRLIVGCRCRVRWVLATVRDGCVRSADEGLQAGRVMST